MANKFTSNNNKKLHNFAAKLPTVENRLFAIRLYADYFAGEHYFGDN